MSSSNCSTVSTFKEIRCHSKVQVHKVNYTWTIDNFDFREAKGSILYSPKFSASSNNGIKWELMLFPNGNKIDAKDAISFYLRICDSLTEKVYTKFEVSVLDFQKKKQRTLKTVVVGLRFDDEPNWGFKKYLEKDDYFKTKLLIDNKLTIYCKIIFSKVCEAVTSHERKALLIHPNAPACDLSDNFGQLLEHRKLADVILSVNGQEFPAHKIILAARSPVFAAMFEHNVKENEENCVYINDMDEEVASEMLRYIYTGKCEKLPELATGLLSAADKYHLDYLKIICAEELYKTISVENAANILALADMHGVEKLKTEVIQFIVSEHTEVLNTEDWKNIRSVELLNEVCSALAHR